MTIIKKINQNDIKLFQKILLYNENNDRILIVIVDNFK